MARTGSRLATNQHHGAAAVQTSSESGHVRDQVTRALELVAQGQGSQSSAFSLLGEAWRTDADACLCALSELLKRCLVVYTKDAGVERVFEFVAAFAASESGTPAIDGSVDKENSPFGEYFGERMLSFFTRLLAAKDKAVRYRSCEAIASLMKAFGDATSRDTTIWSRLTRALLERTRDRVPMVRARALVALHAMYTREAQIIDDETCKSFERLITSDTSTLVRRTALAHAVLTPQTKLLDAVLSRTRDVDERIRAMVYQQVLSGQVDPRMLSIAQRVELLQRGASDRSPMVRRACLQTMLRENWLERVCDGRLTSLMRLLDVEVNETTALSALTQMLIDCPETRCLQIITRFMSELRQATDHTEDEQGRQQQDEACPVDLNELNAERAAVAYVSAQVIAWKARRGRNPIWSHRLAAFLPCTADLCAALLYYHRHAVDIDAATPDVDATSSFISNPEHSKSALETSAAIGTPQTYAFVVRMLLKMASVVDLSDEAGRRILVSTLQTLIRSPRFRTEELELALGTLMRAQADVSETTRLIAEMVTGLHTSTDETETEPEAEQQCSSGRCLAMTEALLQVLLMHWHRLGHQFSGRSSLRQRMDSSSFTETAAQTLMPTLMSLFSACALNHLTSDDSDQRLAAVNVLGLYGLVDQTGQLAMQHALLLLHVSENDVEAVRLVALRALFDWLCVFPFESASSEDQSQSSKDSWASDQDRTTLRRNLLDRLCMVLTSADTDSLQSIVVEGFAKLIFLRRLAPDAELIKRLLLLFFTPTTADNPALRQCLAVFFPSICLLGTAQHRHAFEQTFLPTLRVLVNSPKLNPLATVSPVQAGQYIMYLLDPSRMKAQPMHHASGSRLRPDQALISDENVHLRLAIEMLNEIILEPRAELALVCARLLPHVSLPSAVSDADTTQILESINRLIQSALEEASNATLRRLLERFASQMQAAVTNTMNTSASPTVETDPNSSETSIQTATADQRDVLAEA